MGLQGELHTGITDLRVAISDFRVEVEVQHAGMRDDLRADMEAQHAEIHSEIIHLRERITKIETRLDSTVAPPPPPTPRPSDGADAVR